MHEKPWIILTLRRTGGTELTTALAKLSAFRTIEHEPFNAERKLGAITQAFDAHGDTARLRADIDAALTDTPNIKHCIEVLPMAVTRELIDAGQARGYHMIVLTRRNEAKRIGSLLLAQATGAWGASEAADVYPKIIAGSHQPHPIDLARLPHRVHVDFAALGQTLTLLRNRAMQWDWQVFEDIYRPDGSAATQVIAIAARAGIAAQPDDPRLQVFAKSKGQNSADIADYVPNYAEALVRLQTLCAA
ncbi:hypothetical protein ROE7235_00295 [Roseibaca ekhonensis]|jgi:hypothetical protein|uniref:Stf0 sulfotransferase n=1 Tax=Roseinatronobacter ekhonensis TaxID=254356 RepID=A0A3B0M342_9RHOB|nr:hypothetical protein [Roseibaca ekhonensis]SUZ30571.1 hypothetical protein ROE7235_00295 [Roseibaca ekhonensis]